MSTSELACVYASLILADDDVTITPEKISALLKADDVEVEPYWPGLFAKALVGRDIKAMITSAGALAGATLDKEEPVGETAKDEPAEDEVKVDNEDDDEEEGDNIFDLFDG